MSTQSNPKITALMNSMVAAGVPLPEAYAFANAVEFALDSSNYAKIYGTVNVDALNKFLDRLEE